MSSPDWKCGNPFQSLRDEQLAAGQVLYPPPPVLVCCSNFPPTKKARILPREDHIEMDGTITDALGGGQYRVTLREGGSIVRGKLSGRMKSNHIRVIPGDKVKISVSPYDLTHGLITQRARA